MAATAAAAVGSSFSTTIQSLKCTKALYAEPILKTTSTRSPLQVTSISHILGIEPISIVNTTSRRWWVPKITAQEDAAVTAPVVAEEEEVGSEEKKEEEKVVLGEGESTEEEEEEVESEEKKEEEVILGEGENTDNVQTNVAVNTKLYIGNLPYLCDSAQLAGIIQDYGSPELIEVLYDKNTGKSRGFAFVTMSTVEDCQSVIDNLNGSEYGGRILRVNFADKPRAKEPLYPETDYKLFIGNLSWSVTSESLTQLFQQYGTVIGARVLYDGETGRSRGYGFVCYPTQQEMENALQSLNGVELEGREIRVSLAEGKRR